jgi:hypothetical protein
LPFCNTRSASMLLGVGHPWPTTVSKRQLYPPIVTGYVFLTFRLGPS